MARAKRNREQRQRDLAQMVQWRHEGLTERQIAAKLGLSQSVIHRDLQEIDRTWLESISGRVDALKRAQLGAIGHALHEAWQEFHRSRETTMRVTEHQKRVPLPEQPAEALADGVTSVLSDEFVTVSRTITTESGAGDPRWMKEIGRLLDDRARLLGLYGQPNDTFNVKRFLVGVADELGIDASELMLEAEETAEEWSQGRWKDGQGGET